MSISDRGALPTGWTVARLPNLISHRGVLTDGDWVETEDQDPNGDVRLTQLADVGDGVFRNRSNRFMTSAKAASLQCTFLQPGDVLVARMPDPLGRACNFPGDPRPSVSVVDVCIIRPATEYLSSRWLMNFINAPHFRAAVARLQSGSTRKRISKANLCTIQLPVPPAPEQQRIVEAIESYFSRLDDAVATLERVQRNLKRYRASVLKAAVEGRLVPTEAELAHAEGRDYEPASVLLERILAERRRRWQEADGRGKYQEPVAPDRADLRELPEGWCWAGVDGLLREPLRNGHSARRAVDGNVRTLTLTAVTERDFSEANTKLTAADQQQVQDLWLEPNDIFVERSNTPELVGTAALYRGPSGFAIFPDLLIRVRAADHVLPPYVEAVLRSPHARTFFRQAAQGIAGSMPKISQETVAALAVPLPPTMEQARIVAELERQLSLAEEAEASVTMSQMRCARLRQAILKWAFEGRLADQDPSDEPASVLLERIRTETATRMGSAPTGTPPKRRGRRGTMPGTKHTK